MAQPLPAPSPSSAAPPPQRRGSRIAKRVILTLAFLIALLAVMVVAAGLWVRNRVAASLPQLDGERRLAGLSASVAIDRDELGVPTIHAASRLDAARAVGFLHAQDRFFQMDLLRRQAAGELAEIIGPAVVKSDRDHRVPRFRDVARRVAAMAPPSSPDPPTSGTGRGGRKNPSNDAPLSR